MNDTDVEYTVGIPESYRHEAALLYDEAFGPKFGVAVRSRERRLALLSESLQLSFGIAAIEDGKLIGLSGFKTKEGSLTGGMDYAQLVRSLGRLRGNWTALIFSLYERKPVEGQLLMDGISVKAEARGRGIGGRLLEEVERCAVKHDCDSVRLDVIDTNPQAKRLYERKGFVVTKSESFEMLRWLLGFGGSETLVKSLPKHGSMHS